jgi:hypothetical protein
MFMNTSMISWLQAGAPFPTKIPGLWDFAILLALRSVAASHVQGQLLLQWQRISEGATCPLPESLEPITPPLLPATGGLHLPHVGEVLRKGAQPYPVLCKFVAQAGERGGSWGKFWG